MIYKKRYFTPRLNGKDHKNDKNELQFKFKSENKLNFFFKRRYSHKRGKNKNIIFSKAKRFKTEFNEENQFKKFAN